MEDSFGTTGLINVRRAWGMVRHAGIVGLDKTVNSRLCVHLSNCPNTTVADDYAVIDQVPLAGPIKSILRVSKRPRSLEWLPDNGTVSWSRTDGTLTATVLQAGFHGALVLVP